MLVGSSILGHDELGRARTRPRRLQRVGGWKGGEQRAVGRWPARMGPHMRFGGDRVMGTAWHLAEVRGVMMLGVCSVCCWRKQGGHFDGKRQNDGHALHSFL
jgi:hypothetical protein